MITILNKLFGTFLGVEFRDDTIVLTVMKNGAGGMSMISASSFPLKTDDITLSEIRGYINQQGSKPDRVFVSIPDKWAITRITEMPSLKGKGKAAVANLMKFEIERHIPFNIDEVFHDFLILEEKGAAFSVAFIAVHKEKIEYVRDYLEKISLKADTIIPSSFAVLNTIELSGVSAGGLQEVIGIVRRSKIAGRNGETNISFYVDKTDACMSVLKDGRYVYHRAFPYKIEQRLGEFLNDITHYLKEIQARLSIDRFNTLILSGDLSSVENSVNDIREALGVNVITIDQVSDFTKNIRREEIRMLAPAAGACFGGLGLSSYKVNLLPHKKEFEAQGTLPISTRVFLVLILVLVLGIFTTEAVKKKKYLENIEGELKKNEPMVAEVERISTEVKGLQKQIGLLRSLRNNEITLELLTEITGLIPKDAWITNLEYRIYEEEEKADGVGELVMSGFAASSSSLIPLLEDSPYLEKVAFVGPVKKTGEKEQFKLSAQVVLREKGIKENEQVKQETVVPEPERGKQEQKKEGEI